MQQCMQKALCDDQHFAGAKVTMLPLQRIRTDPPPQSEPWSRMACGLLAGTPKASNRSGLQTGNASQVSLASMQSVHAGSCADDRQPDDCQCEQSSITSCFRNRNGLKGTQLRRPHVQMRMSVLWNDRKGYQRQIA